MTLGKVESKDNYKTIQANLQNIFVWNGDVFVCHIFHFGNTIFMNPVIVNYDIDISKSRLCELLGYDAGELDNYRIEVATMMPGIDECDTVVGWMSKEKIKQVRKVGSI